MNAHMCMMLIKLPFAIISILMLIPRVLHYVYIKKLIKIHAELMNFESFANDSENIRTFLLIDKNLIMLQNN